MARDHLYIDIETIPEDIPGRPERTEFVVAPEEVKCPSSYKKKETIKNWEMETKPRRIMEAKDKAMEETDKAHKKAIDEYEKSCKKQSLSSIDCKVIAISMAINNEKVINIYDEYMEENIIQRFFESDYFAELQNPSRSKRPRIVAFNGINFDLPVLAAKLWKYIGYYDAAQYIPYNVKPWDTDQVFDPSCVFPSSGNDKYVSFARVCGFFGVECKGKMTGADVLPYYLEGRLQEISEYCEGDVNDLRNLCKKMGMF